MKDILIRFIPESHMKHPWPNNIGDYWEDADTIHIRIARMTNVIDMAGLAIHEVWEKIRCNQDGITDEEITAWDLAHPECDDPGMLRDSPYHRQHVEATLIQEIAVTFAGRDIVDHDNAMESACNPNCERTL